MQGFFGFWVMYFTKCHIPGATGLSRNVEDSYIQVGVILADLNKTLRYVLLEASPGYPYIEWEVVSNVTAHM